MKVKEKTKIFKNHGRALRISILQRRYSISSKVYNLILSFLPINMDCYFRSRVIENMDCVVRKPELESWLCHLAIELLYLSKLVFLSIKWTQQDLPPMILWHIK